MIFNNRKDAGQKLAKLLHEYKDRPNVLVIGLPRGGVVVAAEVAKELNAPLDIIVARKVGAPGNKEYAIGAVTEAGYGIFNEEALQHISENYLQQEIEKEKKEAKRRMGLYRKGRDDLDLRNKIVIIVDDGIATGFTMRAAIASAKKMGAREIIVSAPTASSRTVKEMESEVNEIVVFNDSPLFRAVGQFYKEFDQTSDEEVIEIMRKELMPNTLK